MPKVKFDNGTIVEFDRMPTPQDIEEVANQLGINKPAQSKQSDLLSDLNARDAESKKSLLEKTGDFIGVSSLGKSIGVALSRFTPEVHDLEKKIASGNASNEELQAYQDIIGSSPIQDTKSALKVGAGTALSVASNLVGGGATKNVAGATLKGQMLRGLGAGALGGAKASFLGTAGQNLQQGKTVDQSVAEGISSGLQGGVLGGLVGGGAPLAGKVIRKAIGVKPAAGSSIMDEVAKSARKIEGTGINTGISKLPNRIAQNVAEGAEKKVAMANAPAQVRNASAAQIDDAWLDMVKEASYEDNLAMKQMIQMAKNSQGKLVKERPVSIAGKSVLDRVNFLKGKRTEVGRAIGDVKKNLPDKQVDITGEVDDFMGKLDGIGIKIGKKGTLDFTDSALNTPYSNEDKTLLDFIWSEIKPDKNGVSFRTPKALDMSRSRIQSALSSKPKNIGETTYAETLAQGLRSALKEKIKDVAPAYKKLSNQYAENTKTLQDFYQYIGKEWNKKGGNITDLRAGEVMNRILGNAAAKPQYILQQLEEVAKKAGREKTDDPLFQVAFSDLLENVFGSTQPRSLGGQVERATMSASEKINLANLVKSPLQTAGQIIDKFGTGDKQKQQALEDLIDYYLGQKK